MLESFFAAIRVVMPMAILMFLGYLSRNKNLIDRPSMKKVDGLLYRIFMPCLLFKNIYEIDFSKKINPEIFIFASCCMLIIFLVAIFLPVKIIKDRKKAASIGQAVVRGNYILFGVAVSESLYGEGNIGTVILLGAFVVPAINCLSAIILELARSGRANPLRLFIAILKNPMIIGAILAFIFKAIPFQIPVPIWSVIKSLANSTTTVSFLSLGVGLDFAQTRHDVKPLITGVILRMGFVPLIFLTLGAVLGFRGQNLCALMVMLAAPTAVASYPMAVAMGADGQLAGELVCVTTLLSIFTIFLWTFIFSNLGLL